MRAARKAGWSSEEAVRIRGGEPTGEAGLDTLLAVARQIAADKGEVDDATWKAATGAGWSETELTELFAHVAVNLYTNYFNHYVRTDLDVPKAPGLD